MIKYTKKRGGMSVKISTVLFDLDGTLLPMDQDEFMRAYFGLLAKKLVPHGYDPKKLVSAILQGCKAMIRNDGEKTNEEIFWGEFVRIFGDCVRADYPIFEEFYINDFDKARTSCGFDPSARTVVEELRRMGYRVALATNPLFPAAATERRIKWAGLSASDFEIYTTYENSKFCKPNLKYYIELTEKLKVDPRECLMVGNDVGEDMIASELGMQVFLVTNCLINKSDTDISKLCRGKLTDIPLLKNGIKQ